MDPVPALKSLLLQNDFMGTDANVLIVTPATHQVFIYWRYQTCPSPSFSLEGLRTPSVPYPMLYQLLITSGKQTKTEQKNSNKNKQKKKLFFFFSKGLLFCALDQGIRPCFAMKILGTKRKKKVVTSVSNFISISKDKTMLNMISICDMPLKLCCMLRMLTPCKWHVLCPYLHCFAYRMNRQTLPGR